MTQQAESNKPASFKDSGAWLFMKAMLILVGAAAAVVVVQWFTT